MFLIFDLGIVRAFRIKKRLTQDYLCKKSKISKSYISRMENGNCKTPTLQVIFDLAKAMEICPAMLATCNCKDCSIVLDVEERLVCKKKSLILYEKAVYISKNLVEYELKNIDKLDHKNLSYGDSKHIRDNNLM